jgi:hypothetical protein
MKSKKYEALRTDTGWDNLFFQQKGEEKFQTLPAKALFIMAKTFKGIQK